MPQIKKEGQRDRPSGHRSERDEQYYADGELIDEKVRFARELGARVTSLLDLVDQELGDGPGDDPEDGDPDAAPPAEQ